MRNGKIFTRFQKLLKLVSICILFASPFSGFAQYDYEHYVPPFYNGSYTPHDVGYHRAILSTNSVKDITVYIYKGYDTEIAQVTISNKSPYSFAFTRSDGNEQGEIISYPHTYNFPKNVVGAKELNKILADEGIRFYSSDAPFFVNIRHSTRDQGLSLTTKGTYAYGTDFLSGHVYTHQNSATKRRSHFISVMATEDNTVVNFTDIKVSRLTKFNSSTNGLESELMSPSDVITATLNKGESYVIGVDHDLPGFSNADMNAMNGTSITSSKPIAVNSGSWTAGPLGQDIGVDQIVPIDQVRNEYIILRGQGDNTTERIILVATEDNTEVSVNGTVVGQIDKKGEHMTLTNPYDSNGNVYVTSDKNIYVYQTLSGSSSIIGPTVGMNFIPPVSTSGIREVTVPYAEVLAQKPVSGVITILTQTGSVVNYSKDGDVTLHPITDIVSSSTKIAGVPQWEIYKLDKNLAGSYRFYSNKAINVAWLVESKYVGAAGYYSGFTKAISKKTPDLEVDADGSVDLICESYDDDIRVTIKEPTPDFYEWYVNDFNSDPIIVNDPLVVPAPDVETSYYVVGSYRDPRMDQLFNGSFFEKTVSSDYTEVFGNLRNPGEYTTVSQTTSADPSFKNPIFKDMDNDYMFMAISNNSGDVMYRGTSIDVVKGFNYIVKLHGRSVTNTTYTEPQSLKVLVNGDTIIDNFKIDKTDEWQSVSALWKPKGAPNAILKILNNNASGVRSAFALDSITFVQAVQDTAQFVARVIPNYSYSNNGKTFHFCEGTQNSLDVSNGDTSWYDYSWAKKDQNSGNYIDLADGAEFSGTDTHELIFKNPQQDNEGNYRCTITFKEEYQQCGSSSNAIVDLIVLVDKLATVKIDADKTHFCYGTTATLAALVTGDAGQVKWYVNGGADPVSLENPFVFAADNPAGTYTVRCEAENGCGLAFDEVTLEVYSAPDLNSLTVNPDLCENDDIILTANATGNGTLTYYWKEGTSDLNEHGSVLTFPATMDHRDSIYSVSVSSIYTTADGNIECPDDVTLSIDNLDIYPNVTITDPLDNATICEGSGNHIFSVLLSQPESFYNFAWEKDGLSIPGDLAQKIISPIATGDDGQYKVIVSNRCDTKESTATLTVVPKMVVNSISADLTGPFCNATNVTVTFTDNGAIAEYKAKKPDGSEIIITNPYTFEINPTTEGSWEFIAEPNCTGNPVTKTFNWEMIPDFGTVSMNDVTTCIGKDVDFIADINDIPTLSNLTYEWKDNTNTIIVGATTGVLSLTNVQEVNTGTYTCTVTDQCGRSKQVTANLNIEKVTTPTTTAAIEKCVGGTDFRIDIAYVGTPTFKWRHNDPLGAVISTSGFYAIPSLTVADAGIYYCTVELECGNVIQIQRELIVNEHVSIVNPADETIHICEGEKPVFKVEVNGNSDDYVIDWTNSGDVSLGLGDVNQVQLGVHNTPGTFTYKAKVTSFCDNLNKNYIVEVHEKPKLTAIDPIHECEGDILLTANVVGTDYVDVEWWNSDESTKLGTGVNYTILGATYPASEGIYIAKVTTEYCGSSKTNALVNIYEPVSHKPIANLTPTPCEGTPLKLVVEGIGDGVQYSWHKNLVSNPQLATSSVLDLGNADAALHSGKYICVLTSSNACPGKTVEFTVNVLQNATVTTPPNDASLCEGITPATFTLTAAGEGNLVYTWYDKDDSKVSEKTNDPNFSVADPLANDGQVYYCVVTPDKCASITSKQVGLHVKKKVIITSEPVDVKIAENGNATFSVEADGEPVIAYQWQISTDGGTNWSDIVAETNKSLLLTSVPLASNGNKYRCIVTNACNFKTTREALLIVDANAKITVQPVDLNVCLSDKAEFKIDASGVGLIYEWQYRENNTVPFVNASAIGTLKNGDKTLEIDPVTLAMKDWEFKCIVSGTGPSDESNVVKINVFEPITYDEISDEILCNGSGALFSVENLNGSTPYSYTWKRETVTIATGSQLNLDAASATDATYWIEVSNGVCPAIAKDFVISHHPDLDVNAWSNVDETCATGSPVEVLDVTVNNSAGGLKYTWTKDDDANVLSSTNTYTLPGLSSAETGTYKVKVEDKCTSVTISGFVNVYTPISKVNTWPANLTPLCLGTELVLDVEIDGDHPTYAWTVPNAARTPGNGSSIKFDDLSMADQGTYTCKITDKCGTSLIYTTELKIIDAPSIDAPGIENLVAVCEGEPLVLGAINVTGSYDDIEWTLNNGSLNPVAGVQLDLGNATLAMEGNYKVEVSNACGSDISVGTQVVNPKPKLEPIADQFVCEGEDVVFRAKATGRDLNYQWKIDGVIQASVIPTLLISGLDVLPADPFTPKTYTIECIVTDANGCGGTIKETAELKVNPSTIILSTLRIATKFVGEDYTMKIDATGHNLTYKWTHVKDGVTNLLAETTNTLTLTNIQLSDAGYYHCEITGSCGTRLASGKLTVKEPVIIHEGLASLVEKCDGEPLSLHVNASGYSSVQWLKNGSELVGETDLTLYIAELTSADAGEYTCRIEGDGAPAGGIVEKATVRVYENTTLLAPLGTMPICERDELEWIPNVKGAANIEYKWFFSGTEVSTDKILHYDAILLAQEGDYEVQVTGLCGDVSSKGTLEVIELPSITSISNDKEACENESLVEFKIEATGENLKYQWKKNGADMPGKTSPVLSLTSIQLDDEASYTCNVYNSCATVISNEMKLKVTPQLKILSDIADIEVCSGEEISFTADVNGNNVTYQWKLDGVDLAGETSSVLNLGKTTSDDSGYYTCIVSDNCTDSRSTKPTELTVHELPNSRILGRMVLCAKEDRVTYTTDDLPEIEYGWGVDGGIFAGPDKGLKTRVTWGELDKGELSIMIVDVATGCESKVDSLVTLNALPTVNLAAFESKGVCNESFTLSGGYPEGGIYWVDDISEEIFDPKDKGPGTYNIHYSYTDAHGCSNVTNKTTLRVDPLPTVNITDNVTIGSCKPFVLNAVTDEKNIQWSPATNLDDANSMTPTFTPGKSQVLIATVMDEHGCPNMDLVELTVAPLPIVTTIADTTVGQCNQLLLKTDIVGDAGKITWTNPDHLDDPDTRSPKIINAPEGIHTYKISVTDLYGCDAEGKVVVNMVADPVLPEDKFGCYGDEFEIDVTGMQNPFWSNPEWKNKLRDSINNLSKYTVDTVGQYKLEVSNEHGCGDEQKFVINPTPNPELRKSLIFDGPEELELIEGRPVTILEGQTVTIAPNLPLEYSPYRFTWEDGKDGSIHQRYDVSETGTYKLTVEDKLGCLAVDSVHIEVKPVGIESPNAFTPNSSNENDRFYLKDINYDIDKFEMYVYNRWGELLYKTNETGKSGGWDGKYNGKLCPAGAYVWMVFINGELTNKGTFMLLR
jgi:gliding motility-associated-like protein